MSHSKRTLLFHKIQVLSSMVALIQDSRSLANSVQREDRVLYSMEEILMKLGLSQNEIKIYVYLYKNGIKKAKEIAKNQKISRTQIYHLLNSLQNKGMITVIPGRVTKFQGTEFEKALDILLDNEIRRFEELQLMRAELNELWRRNF